MGKHDEKLLAAFGQKLQIKRKSLGFSTQSAFARAVGTDQGTVSNWENGQNMPEKENREAVKRVLNVEEDFFQLDYQSLDTDSLKKVREDLERLQNQVKELLQGPVSITNHHNQKEHNEFIREVSALLPFLKENDLTWFLGELRRAAGANGYVDKSKNS